MLAYALRTFSVVGVVAVVAFLVSDRVRQRAGRMASSPQVEALSRVLKISPDQAGKVLYQAERDRRSSHPRGYADKAS